MRFMMIVRATPDTEAGVMPSEKDLATMGAFNEEMAKAGIMLDGAGLQASSKGALVKFGKGGKPTLVDGPFAEAKELIAGYWVIDVKSKEEAIAWARRAPMADGDAIEIRQYFEMDDFGPSEAVDKMAELVTQEQENRQRAANRAK
jgi:hypothetical protein